MDNYLQYASHGQQQQMCSVALMNAYAVNLANTHPMQFMAAAGGGGYNQQQDGDDDCEDDEDEEQSRTLFCSNLDERVSEEILYEVFLQAGPIESARIPLDNTGRQRSFGFVTYQHKSAVPFAVELYQGLELFQKKIVIRQQYLPAPTMPLNDHTGGSRHARQDNNKQFGVQNKYNHNNHNNNNDMRRRNDSTVIDRNRPRLHQQQQHNNSGGNRRSDQRYNHNKRRLL